MTSTITSPITGSMSTTTRATTGKHALPRTAALTRLPRQWRRPGKAAAARHRA